MACRKEKQSSCLVTSVTSGEVLQVSPLKNHGVGLMVWARVLVYVLRYKEESDVASSLWRHVALRPIEAYTLFATAAG